MTRHGHVGAFAHIAADAKWATTGPAISEWQFPMWVPDGGKNLGFLELFYWKNGVYGLVFAALQWGFIADAGSYATVTDLSR